MSDKIIKATAADNTVSIAFCDMKDACNDAIKIHGLEKYSAEALCRALIGATLMASTLKNKDELVTLSIRGDGPAKGITVTANEEGSVKGYVHNPNATGDSVHEVLGSGLLTVTKDIGLREPYTGQMPLVTGEIAEDITAYFAESEQIPSSCGIGIRFNDDGTIKAAGGFLIQLLPDAPYYVIDQLEMDLARHPSPPELLLKYGNDFEKILIEMLPALNTTILSEKDIKWECKCSERIDNVLIAIGKDELEDMIKEDENIEIICDFCNKKYEITPDQLKEVYKKL